MSMMHCWDQNALALALGCIKGMDIAENLILQKLICGDFCDFVREQWMISKADF